MSLGGLAIAIGLMVDGSVVLVENVFAKLGHARGEDRLCVVRNAVLEVGTPVVFGILIIILVFLPLMTLEGMEGKMFAPLAYTISIALGISLLLSLTLSPVLSAYLLKGGSEHDRSSCGCSRRRMYSCCAGRRITRRTIALAFIVSARHFRSCRCSVRRSSRDEGRDRFPQCGPRAEYLAG